MKTDLPPPVNFLEVLERSGLRVVENPDIPHGMAICFPPDVEDDDED